MKKVSVAEYVTPADTEAVVIDIETGPYPQIKATPVRIQDSDVTVASAPPAFKM